MVVKAAALALREHPRANGSYRDGKLRLHSRINVGVAVAADDALVVPTVFDADEKSLGEIAGETRALAERVRAGAITPPELGGGTFTVSNLGMYGVPSFTAIINPPQAAILSVGALEPRAVVRGRRGRCARHMMTLTLACDHRILYGAEAAAASLAGPRAAAVPGVADAVARRAGAQRGARLGGEQMSRCANPTGAAPRVWVCHLGIVPYARALAMQEHVRARRQAGEIPDTPAAARAPAVYTRGQRRRRGAPARRGLLPRARHRRDRPPTAAAGSPTTAPGSSSAIRSWRSTTSSRTCARWSGDRRRTGAGGRPLPRPARGRPRLHGCLGAERKIACIGVHVSRGVTTHGFAINVDNDLEPFSWVLACGLPDVTMTSLEREHEIPGAGLGCLRKRMAMRFCAGPRGRQRLVPPRWGPATVPARAPAERAPRTPSPTDWCTRMSATRSRSNPGGMDVLSVLGPDVRPLRERKPPWFKVPPPGGERYRELTELIRAENLHTVCQEAACPNVGECWERGTATFMILGDTCTRRCGFCNVKTGRPTWNDPLEPARVARSIARMGLRHAVITSVDRDDLPDKGASAFVGVIRQVRRQAPELPDRGADPRLPGPGDAAREGDRRAPRRLQPQRRGRAAPVPVARRGSEFPRSCRVLRLAGELGEGRVVTKSGLMVGLGETHDEMIETFAAAARAAAYRCSPSGSTCGPPSATSPLSATGTPTSSRRSSGPLMRSASTTSPRGRSCAPPTTPTSTYRSP